MARGFPDYQTLSTQTVRVEQGSVNQNVYDTGFSRVDGGGRVVFYDDFRSGLNRYALNIFGTGLSAELDFSEGHLFGFSPSAKLQPNGNGGYSQIATWSSSPISGNCGMEISFFLSLNHGRLDVSFIPSYSNTSSRVFTVSVNANTETVQLSAGDGAHIVYTPAQAGFLSGRHMGMKMVVDPLTGEYKSLYIAGELVDLTGYFSPQIEPFGKGSIYLNITATGTSAIFKESAWVDYVVISADEP